MIKTEKNIFRQTRIIYFLSLVFSIVIVNNAVSQTASSGSVLLASLDKKEAIKAVSTVNTGNVVFPEILKGNEEQALEYIENFSEKRRGYLVSMYNKGQRLLPQAAAILKAHGLPEELKVLLALESAYNPNARSKAGAVGYWQFMDNVAKEYGMKIAQLQAKQKKIKGSKHAKNKAIARRRMADDRKNFIKSTTAAARYLCDRRKNLNDNWLLMVASYNCGVGNVWNAMEKSGVENPGFWDIKDDLPAETRAYVMNFITLNVIFANYDNFINNNMVFKEEKIVFPVRYDEVPSDAGIDASSVSKLQ